MDQVNRKLLQLLRTNGRASIDKAAHEWGMKPSTLRGRFHKMVADGVIERFTISIPEGMSRFRSFRYIVVQLSRNTLAAEEAFRDLAQRERQIIFCDQIEGGKDFVLYIGCYEDSCYDRIKELIRTIDPNCDIEAHRRIRPIKGYLLDVDDIL